MSTVGTFVGHVIGRDPDKGQNGRFNCSIDDSHFRLKRMFNEEYHVLTSAIFDREQTARYRLAIVCQDYGHPASLIAVKLLMVDVLDVNDNPPKFSQSVYLAEIQENNVMGGSVLQLQAKDADVGENAVLTYVISGNQSQSFSVDPMWGLISGNSKIDYEQTKEFRFLALVYDSGIPRLTGTANVVVRILDVNDEKPEFLSKAYAFRIEEHQPAGTGVGTVSAQDADSFPNNQFSFQLLSSEDESSLDAFRIDRTSGRLITARELDREKKPIHRLVVVARDDGVQSLASSVSVTVELIDINDGKPTFVFPTDNNRTVIASDPVLRGQTIAVISAKDSDVGRNAELRYSVMSKGNTHRLFTIDAKSGRLSATNDIHGMADNRTFNLKLMVADRGEVPHQVFADLVVVIKKFDHASSAFRYNFLSENIAFNGQNFVAVVALCSVTAVVIVVLIAAIVYVARQNRNGSDTSGLKPKDRKEVLKDDLMTGSLTESPGSKSCAMLIDANGTSADRNGRETMQKLTNGRKNTSKVSIVRVSMTNGNGPKSQTIAATDHNGYT